MKKILILSAFLFVLVACDKSEKEYGVINLSESGTANCYIVEKPGLYKINATLKGNGGESIEGSASSACVLWESFGTDIAPKVGAILSEIKYENGYISFRAKKEGNAVVALQDESGTILWSWHIWVCIDYDPLANAVAYFNNTVKVMDRNLGATTAEKGNPRSLGFYYQWGRKDPFPTGNDISNCYPAAVSTQWPNPVASNSQNGTIEYTVAHPMTFICYNSGNYDWLYTGSWETDETRWLPDSKTIYDPCPLGWKIPKGGEDGLWAKAMGNNAQFPQWDGINRGWNFGGILGSDPEIWYPAAGFQMSDDGSIAGVGDGGFYWSGTAGGYGALYLNIYSDTYISPNDSYDIANCHSVRCVSEF